MQRQPEPPQRRRSRSRGGTGSKIAQTPAGAAAWHAAAAAAPSCRGAGLEKRKDAAKLGVTRPPAEAEHFAWVRGQQLGSDGRYVVRRFLGDGTFGRVLACRDTKTMENVAVKVVKGVKRYCEHAEAEAEVLREILRCDPGRQSHCVELKDTFLHPRRHFCLVFEHLDVSLRDFLKAGGSEGLFASDVRDMAEQLLQCLSFLHAINCVHTDIKCRNVLLRDSRHEVLPLPRSRSGATAPKLRQCEIVVIDFGGAVFKEERGRSCIGTRQFRAPEVVLGLPWDEKVDIWSAGCIIAMAYLGERPFSVREDMEHLALIERRTGRKVPPEMAREAASTKVLPQGVAFDNKGKLDWPGQRAEDEEAVAHVEGTKPLRDIVRPQHRALLELLEGMLQIDPRLRLSAETASMLPFVVAEQAPE